MSRAIPKGWSVKSFYQLGTIANGQVDPRLEPYRRMVLVAPDHIESGTGRISVEYTAAELGAISGKYLVQPNDVIYSKIRPNLQKLALADKACLCSADMYPITAKEGVSPHFLKFVLLSDNFTDFAVSVSARSGMPKINRQEIGAFTTAVPDDPDEQQAIAAALSDADGVVAGLERVIAKKRLIKQGAAQGLLTARRRLPGFSGEWEVKRLGDHVRFLKNGTHSRAQLSENGPVRYLHYGDIHGAPSIFLSPATTPMPTLDTVSARRLDRLAAGDLVFVDASEDLEGVGTSVEITDLGEAEVVAGLHTIAARFDKSVLVDGFKAFLQFIPAFRSHLCQLAAGTKVLATNRSHIASAAIALPRAGEQQAIASVLSDMDAEIQTLESRLAKARAVKEGMMQNLLTGRVRLV
ncbi:MAG: restriction endonuclease subunit S [Pararhodobacter sp.]